MYITNIDHHEVIFSISFSLLQRESEPYTYMYALFECRQFNEEEIIIFCSWICLKKQLYMIWWTITIIQCYMFVIQSVSLHTCNSLCSPSTQNQVFHSAFPYPLSLFVNSVIILISCSDSTNRILNKFSAKPHDSGLRIMFMRNILIIDHYKICFYFLVVFCITWKSLVLSPKTHPTKRMKMTTTSDLLYL